MRNYFFLPPSKLKVRSVAANIHGVGGERERDEEKVGVEVEITFILLLLKGDVECNTSHSPPSPLLHPSSANERETCKIDPLRER